MATMPEPDEQADACSGTSEIQRTSSGERALGLPNGPRVHG
jgi:hypothetical protein